MSKNRFAKHHNAFLELSVDEDFETDPSYRLPAKMKPTRESRADFDGLGRAKPDKPRRNNQKVGRWESVP